MKLGFVSDSLGGKSFAQLLDTAVALGVSGIEVNTISQNYLRLTHYWRVR